MPAAAKVSDRVTSLPMMMRGDAETTFSRVRDEFAAISADHLAGHSLAIYHRGRKVVDLVSGSAQPTEDGAWRRDTLATAFSVSKGVLALLVHRLVDAGQMDIDAPVMSIWPDFGQNGKQDITIRDVLDHRAGLISLHSDLTLPDLLAWEPVIRALEEQKPLWPRGQQFGYHALTWGWLVGEILRRATGQHPWALVEHELRAPLDLDLWLGLPARETYRLAVTRPAPRENPAKIPLRVLAHARKMRIRPEVMRSVTMGTALSKPETAFNNIDVIKAGLPAAGVVATTSSLARLFAAAVGEVDGVRLLSDRSVDAILDAPPDVPHWGGVSSPTAMFSSGFMLRRAIDRPLLSSHSFGHDGALGQLAFADANEQIGFAYNTNRSFGLMDRRADRLVRALRADLSAQMR